jgi:hypothetical protein
MNFFQNSTAADDYFHLQQTMFRLCRPFIILSGWLTTSVVDYHSKWLIYGWYWTAIINNEVLRTIIYYVGWMDDINQLQMIFNYKTDDIHQQQLIFNRFRRYSSKRQDDGCLHGMIINHCRWYSTTWDDNQPKRVNNQLLRMMIGRHRWYSSPEKY